MKCPYTKCGKYKCEPSVVVEYINQYGSCLCNFECIHCGKVIEIYGERRIVFGKPKMTENESDW